MQIVRELSSAERCGSFLTGILHSVVCRMIVPLEVEMLPVVQVSFGSASRDSPEFGDSFASGSLWVSSVIGGGASGALSGLASSGCGGAAGGGCCWGAVGVTVSSAGEAGATACVADGGAGALSSSIVGSGSS